MRTARPTTPPPNPHNGHPHDCSGCPACMVFWSSSEGRRLTLVYDFATAVKDSPVEVFVYGRGKSRHEEKHIGPVGPVVLDGWLVRPGDVLCGAVRMGTSRYYLDEPADCLDCLGLAPRMLAATGSDAHRARKAVNRLYLGGRRVPRILARWFSTPDTVQASSLRAAFAAAKAPMGSVFHGPASLVWGDPAARGFTWRCGLCRAHGRRHLTAWAARRSARRHARHNPKPSGLHALEVIR